MPRDRTILFVCTGNICRTPVAAGLLYDRLVREQADAQIHIRSAGIWALEGRPATAYAQQVMGERDMDISAHRARNITQAIVDDADLILVMTRQHADAIRRGFDRVAGKLHLLAEMAGDGHDVEDPYGGSLAEYRRTAARLDDLIEHGYESILKLLNTREPPAHSKEDCPPKAVPSRGAQPCPTTPTSLAGTPPTPGSVRGVPETDTAQ